MERTHARAGARRPCLPGGAGKTEGVAVRVAFSFLQRGNPADYARSLSLSSYTPAITLADLQLGVDNIRHDVWLSPRMCEIARFFVGKLVAKHGQVEDMVAEDPLLA